jgi:hypothetical protein
MTIRRLDAFFTTRLTLDRRNVFNSVTNIAFSALQHLIGEHKYKCLQGKTAPVPRVYGPMPPPPFFGTVKKVVVYICALLLVIPLTPIGIVTRQLSFRSTEINQAYSNAFLFRIPPAERTSQQMKFAFRFVRRMPEKQRIAFLKELPLDICASYLSLANSAFTNAYLLQMAEPDRTPLLILLPLDIKAPFLSQMAEADRTPLLKQLPLPIQASHLSLETQAYTNAYLLQMAEADRAPLLKQLPMSMQGSFLSLEVNRAYAITFLFQMSEVDRTPLLMALSSDLHAAYQAVREEQKKKEALDTYLGSAIDFLNRLDLQLKNNTTDIQKWLTEASNDPFHPFPFLLAQKLESKPGLESRADGNLWKNFMTLRQSCSQRLDALGLSDHIQEEVHQRTIQLTSKEAVTSALQTNTVFFKTLRETLETPNAKTSEIEEWLDQQKEDLNYPFPFYTYPLILTVLQKLAPGSEKLIPHIALFAACKRLLRANELEGYLSETSDHAVVTKIKLALDQMENIANLQALIRTQ